MRNHNINLLIYSLPFVEQKVSFIACREVYREYIQGVCFTAGLQTDINILVVTLSFI